MSLLSFKYTFVTFYSDRCHFLRYLMPPFPYFLCPMPPFPVLYVFMSLYTKTKHDF